MDHQLIENLQHTRKRNNKRESQHSVCAPQLPVARNILRVKAQEITDETGQAASGHFGNTINFFKTRKNIQMFSKKGTFASPKRRAFIGLFIGLFNIYMPPNSDWGPLKTIILLL